MEPQHIEGYVEGSQTVYEPDALVPGRTIPSLCILAPKVGVESQDRWSRYAVSNTLAKKSVVRATGLALILTLLTYHVVQTIQYLCRDVVIEID